MLDVLAIEELGLVVVVVLTIVILGLVDRAL
jgi:hypothetical protein